MYATGKTNSTDLFSVIQILQILIKEIVLFLVAFTAIFMPRKLFLCSYKPSNIKFIHTSCYQNLRYKN